MTENTAPYTYDPDNELKEAIAAAAAFAAEAKENVERREAIEIERDEIRRSRISRFSERLRIEAGISSAEIASDVLRNKIRYSGFLMDADQVSAESVQIETEIIELSTRLETERLALTEELRRLNVLTLEFDQLTYRYRFLEQASANVEWEISCIKGKIEPYGSPEQEPFFVKMDSFGDDDTEGAGDATDEASALFDDPVSEDTSALQEKAD